MVEIQKITKGGMMKLVRDSIMIDDRIKKINSIAVKTGYQSLGYQENIGMLSYKKGDARINVYCSKMTVATCMNHPKKGKTQMFRRCVDMELLQKIFDNPRIHTGLGYR